MISRNDIISLAKIQAPCVSIYLPTHRYGPETASDAQNFKHVVNTAAHQLRERGITAAVAHTILNPVRALGDHDAFWQHQSEGLAMFASPNFWTHYSLGFPAREQLVVNDIFYLRQLVPYVNTFGNFYLLALSQNSVRLFSANKFSVEEIESKEIPDSMDEALWYEMPQKELQFRSGGAGTAHFHGHGMGEEINKEAVQRFFLQIDHAITPILKGSTHPLVLAGVGYYIPLYKEISHYPYIAEGFVEGSVERKTAEELHNVALHVVDEFYRQPQQKKMEQFNNALGTGLTLDALPDILEAATEGRIDTLFIGRSSDEIDNISEAMINTAIRRVLTSGSEIYETPEIFTDSSHAYALLRY